MKLSFQGIRREIPDGLIHLFEVKKIGKGFIQKILAALTFWRQEVVPAGVSYGSRSNLMIAGITFRV